MQKTVVILLALVIIAVAVAPTGALYVSSVDIGSGGVVSGPESTPTPPVYGTTVEFVITRVVNQWYSDFKIIIRNNTDEPIYNWSLNFNCNGQIYAVWVCFYSQNGTSVSCWPLNEYQTNYVIPANGYIELLANGRMISEIWDVTVSGEAVDYIIYHDYTQYPGENAQPPQQKPEEPKPEAELGAVEEAPSEQNSESAQERTGEAEPDTITEAEPDALTEAEQDLAEVLEKIPEQGPETSEAPAPELEENLETIPE